jgi:thiamine biosynthesis protein ThiC
MVAIGGAAAAMANYLCYVRPTGHIGLGVQIDSLLFGSILLVDNAQMVLTLVHHKTI